MLSTFLRNRALLSALPTIHAAATSLNKHQTLQRGKFDAFETLQVQEQNRVAIFTLNRPKQLNAINSVMAKEILRGLREVDCDPSIAVSVITGQGDVFAAGADLKEISGWVLGGKEEGKYELAKWKNVLEVEKPVIAAVNGMALGGGAEVAMMCDIVVAGENVVFSQPELNVGLIPGMGATQRLIRAVGKSKAMEVILTGGELSADEACRAGLVSKVVKQGEVVEEAIRIAKKIASFSIPIVKKAKKCIVESVNMDLENGLDFEYATFLSVSELDDAKEGVSAFLEKRLPVWKDQ